MSTLLDELRARARDALVHWRLPDQEPELLKYRENAVFKVRLDNAQSAALRLHRPGYHSEAALRSELMLMDELQRQKLNVPRPLSSVDGDFLVAIGGSPTQFADLIGWVDGAQIGESGRPLGFSKSEIARVYRGVGAAMANLHNIADRWTVPREFTRPAWDRRGLLGDEPLWGRFWDCPFLSNDDAEFLSVLRLRLLARLEQIEPALDYGLIHADLVRENVLISGDHVSLIDFDDCGYGFRLFDIATALLRNRQEPYFPLIRSSLLDGYRAKRVLATTELACLPLFMVLRSLTYIGWAANRPELQGTAERIARYVSEARDLTQELARFSGPIR